MTQLPYAKFPETRMRRTRQADWARRLTRETVLTKNDLIWALIFHDGAEPRVPVGAMPGVDRLNLDQAVEAARTARDLGIPALALFPHIDPSKKDEKGTEAGNPNGFVPQVISAIKKEVPEVGVLCDVALDPFTSHGHDGVLNARDEIDNDATLARLVEQSLIQAEAGVDVVAPSDMMDGRIGVIRSALEDDGFHNTMIMSYSAKYASAFYGPYREAIGSAAALKGDKKTYQMDFGNTDEALRETALDISEGRLERVRQNLIRTKLQAKVITGDALEVTGQYDAVLLDAPCSATGTLRRHPDLPHAKDGSEFGTLIDQQARMIDHAMTLLKPGGRLVFCTCSLLPEEGEAQASSFLKKHPDWRAETLKLEALGLETGWLSAEGGLRLRPDYWADLGGMDGFYIAILEKPS